MWVYLPMCEEYLNLDQIRRVEVQNLDPSADAEFENSIVRVFFTGQPDMHFRGYAMAADVTALLKAISAPKREEKQRGPQEKEARVYPPQENKKEKV